MIHDAETPKNTHVCVVVFERKGRVYVNAYGYPTEGAARSHQRRSKRAVENGDVDPSTKVIAIRVRPIIDEEYLADMNERLNNEAR